MEIWKTVKGFENYEVSNFGRVKSLKFSKERILKGGLSSDGYLLVVLCKNGEKKTINIHKLVSMAFLNHKPDGHKITVDHLNGIKTDNRVENLRLCSSRENTTYHYLKRKTSSKFTGVYWNKASEKWMAYIFINGKQKGLGYFHCEIEASNAYEKALKYLTN